VPFEEGFFEDPDTQAIPLVPVDPKLGPMVSVRAPDGQVVKSGLAVPIIPGVWRFEFSVPPDAMLSSPEDKWSITWRLDPVSGHGVEVKRYFDVVEPKTMSSEDRSLSLLTRQDTSVRVVLRRDTDPIELSAKLYQYHDDSVLATYTWNPNDPIGSTIKRVIEGDEIVYYFDTAALPVGEYMVFWDSRTSVTAQLDSVTRMVRVAPLSAFYFFPSLRALVDKLRKRAERLQAYTTAELYDYLLNGVGILNSLHPVTTFGLLDGPFNFDMGSRTALYYASALHAMRAQHILAVETDFDFSGQTVPLKVDRRSGYADAVEKMTDALKAWSIAKLGLFRMANRVGASAVRMPQRRFQNFVVPISRGTGAETFALLSGLSLL
jgi:hypothetical protein